LVVDFQKKCNLGPQNGSRCLGPEKLLKIVNCATIKETKKMKEEMVGGQVELVGGHQYPPRSSRENESFIPWQRHKYVIAPTNIKG